MGKDCGHALVFADGDEHRAAKCFVRSGAALLMPFGGTDHRSLHDKTARALIWTSHHTFQGWTCTQCEWNYPLPTLLTDADARTAYDRLAAAKFREHKCEEHSSRTAPVELDIFAARLRKLVQQGFKPKDAVELFLQEMALEYRGQANMLERAKVAGEDFLRRVKAGLI
jgi:hypothetical protein